MRPRGIEKMSLLRKLFARKALDGLLEISDRIYVLNCCLSSQTPKEEEHRDNLSSIIIQLRNFYTDASFMVLNFMEGDIRARALDALSHFGITVSDYPSHFQNCPLLPLTLIQHFLKSTERWLSFDRNSNNMILLHSEKGAWPLLAFMLSSILVSKKEAGCENKTLEMVYKRVSREMMQLHLELNPQPSHLRYLQYVEKLRGSSDFQEVQLVLDCVILRSIPNFDGERGCRPVIQVCGADTSGGRPKLLFRSSISKKRTKTKYYKQGERHTVIKLNTECHIQGDVVVECVHLTNDDLCHEETMFRLMFNTAFVQSNMVTFTRDELDIAWNGKDKFQEDFKIEVFFSDIIFSEPETPTKETIKDDSHEIQSIATEGDEFFDTEEIVKEPKPIPNYSFKTPVEDDAITESDIHVIESSSSNGPDGKLKLNLTNESQFGMSDIHVVDNYGIRERESGTPREITRHLQKSITSSKMLLPIRGTKKNSITPKMLNKPNLNVQSKVAKIINGERYPTQSLSSPRASIQHDKSPAMSPRAFNATSRRNIIDGSVPSFVTPLHQQLPRVKLRVTDARQKKPAPSVSANLLASPKPSPLATSPRATSPRLPRNHSLHHNKEVKRDSSALSRTLSSIITTGYRTPPHPSHLKKAVMSPHMVSKPSIGAGSTITKITRQNQDDIRRSASMPRSTSVPKSRARTM